MLAQLTSSLPSPIHLEGFPHGSDFGQKEGKQGQQNRSKGGGKTGMESMTKEQAEDHG